MYLFHAGNLVLAISQKPFCQSTRYFVMIIKEGEEGLSPVLGALQFVLLPPGVYIV
jgi:hypothetical protein